MIPYGRQEITEKDIQEVEKVLRSDFLTQGPTVNRFEQKVLDYCQSKYAVAVNSATSALHLACLALDLGPGDILWTSPNTFVASANCGRYCGANVDFVDIDLKTYNICIDALTDKLITAEKEGKLPKILVPVHFAGQPCDMQAIYKLSKRYGFKIIEDASHAIGASYNGIKVGSCQHSDITVFSFHPVKIITTAEGGMTLTNDKILAEKIKRLRTSGNTNDKKFFQERPKDEIWNYQQIDLGFNYRMNDIQAALGISQISRLDYYVECRQKIAKRYDSNLKKIQIILPYQRPEIFSSFHLYPICLKTKELKKTQKQIYNDLRQNGIAVNLHYIPVYLHPYYKLLNFKEGYCKNAEIYFKSVITIPIFPSLTEKAQDEVIRILTEEIY